MRDMEVLEIVQSEAFFVSFSLGTMSQEWRKTASWRMGQ